MELEKVLAILLQIPKPLTDCLESFYNLPFAKNLRFRGGEWGKYLSGWKNNEYIGEIKYNRYSRPGETLVAFTLSDALIYSDIRTISPRGGRYDPKTGNLIPRFKFGFPYLIAIDSGAYEKETITGTEQRILGPIKKEDVIILFGKDERDCLIDNLKLIIGKTAEYERIIQRYTEARKE